MLKQNLRKLRSSETDIIVAADKFCVNLGFIGEKLDKARTLMLAAKTNWAYNYWRQCEAQLLRTWREGVAFYNKPGHGQYVLDLADVNAYPDFFTGDHNGNLESNRSTDSSS